jgi:glutamate synthase (NADPH/NADH) large chain
MSGGIAYVYDPRGRFRDLCNLAMVKLEAIAPPSSGADEADRPRQRSVSADDPGMGDMLRFDAERLKILIERHLLYTNSARARSLLENWDETLKHFVKVMPVDYRRALIELQAERPVAAE